MLWRAYISLYVRWRSEVVAVGQTLRPISSQAGLQLLNVLVILKLSQSSFNYDTDHERVGRTLGDWHCGLGTFMLGSRMLTHASLASLHAPQVRALTTYTTVAMNVSLKSMYIALGRSEEHAYRFRWLWRAYVSLYVALKSMNIALCGSEEHAYRFMWL